MEAFASKIQPLFKKLDGPESLQTWRETPQRGIQYAVLFTLLGIILICETVFQTLFVGVFKLRHGFEDEDTPEAANVVYPYTILSFLLGTMIGNLIFGIVSDRTGRRKTLLLSILLSIPYAWIYVMSLWVIYALNFSTFSAFFILPFSFFLGVFNNQATIVLASAYDISSYLAQTVTAILILLLGIGFGPAVTKELVSFGYLVSVNHGFAFPILGFILSVILLGAFLLAYFFLPETLGKEVPPHPLEAEYQNVILHNGETENISASVITHEINIPSPPPTDDLDHGWIYPLHVLRDIRGWVLFWIAFLFNGPLMSVTFLSLIGITSYNDSLPTPLHDFGSVFIVERVIVAVVGIGVIFTLCVQFPQKIVQIGYLRFLRITMLLITAITIFFVGYTFLLALLIEDWLYWITLIVYPTLLDISFIGSLLFIISLYCMISNVGFRNESGFLFSFIGIAVIGGFISFVSFFMSMNFWLEGLGLYRIPVILFLCCILMIGASALSFYRLDEELNQPRSEQRKHSDKAIDRPIYLGSPILFILIIAISLLFFFILPLI